MSDFAGLPPRPAFGAQIAWLERDGELIEATAGWAELVGAARADGLPERIAAEMLPLLLDDPPAPASEPVRRLLISGGMLLELELAALPDGRFQLAARALDPRMTTDSRALFEQLIEQTPVPMWVKDAELRYRQVNEALAALTHRSTHEFAGRTDEELFGATLTAQWIEYDRAVLATGEASENDQLVFLPGRDEPRRFSTLRFPIRGPDGSVTGVCGTSVELTELVRARENHERFERRAVERQRLEALGRVTAGIAHDFNNALSVIVNYTHYLAGEFGDDHRLRPDIDEIARCAEQAAELMHQLQLLARRDDVALEPVDVVALIAVLPQAVRGVLGKGTELVFDVPERLPPVAGQAGLIEQSLVHFVENAAAAVNGGGRICVRARRLELAEDDVPLDSDLLPGEHVSIEVVDDGHGMDAATLARAFQPFFSTKTGERGAGLGLAAVYWAMKRVGGHAELQSGTGGGTIARVLLPVAAAPPAAHDPPPLATNGERVLVVDDHPGVRELMRRVMAGAGYAVRTAGGADEAEALLAAEPVDLIVTDVSMPGRSGPELVRAAAGRLPGVRAAYVSARPRGSIDGQPVLAKPFTPDALLRAARAALEKKP